MLFVLYSVLRQYVLCWVLEISRIISRVRTTLGGVFLPLLEQRLEGRSRIIPGRIFPGGHSRRIPRGGIGSGHLHQKLCCIHHDIHLLSRRV